ncbi:MAG: hypothetical protein LBL13_04850 [Bacteroidales bacterium]|jgi:hypothetical protein|nr:hypothetical protein [Bacteroidales bacterium]
MQHATSNRQASQEGRKDEGERAASNRQQATGRQAARKGKGEWTKGRMDERANGRKDERAKGRKEDGSKQQVAGRQAARQGKGEWVKDSISLKGWNQQHSATRCG